jgi:hypothetical protein
MLTGLVVLLLRLFPTGLDSFYVDVVRWASALTAVALIVGLTNLINVHINKIAEGEGGSFYSVVLIGAFTLTFLLAFGLGPSGEIAGVEATNWIFQYVQVPIEISLTALLAVSLVYAAARLLRRKPNLFSVVFVAAALVALLGTSLAGRIAPAFIADLIGGVHGWLTGVLAASGARGLLIGVALGAVAAGLRVIMGTDRPYGG